MHALRSWSAGLAGSLALLLVLIAGACGSGGAVEVSLAELAQQQDDYSGDEVITSGSVVAFDGADGRYYVIEDAAQNRVLVEPAEEVEPFEGRRITVTGRFEFDPERGRVIEATEVVPADAP